MKLRREIFLIPLILSKLQGETFVSRMSAYPYRGANCFAQDEKSRKRQREPDKKRMAAADAFASFAAILVSLVRGGRPRPFLGGLDVRSLLAFGASGDVERYALSFLERLEATAVDC